MSFCDAGFFLRLYWFFSNLVSYFFGAFCVTWWRVFLVQTTWHIFCIRGIAYCAPPLNVARMMFYCMLVHVFINNRQYVIRYTSLGLFYFFLVSCVSFGPMFTCSITITAIAYACDMLNKVTPRFHVYDLHEQVEGFCRFVDVISLL